MTFSEHAEHSLSELPGVIFKAVLPAQRSRTFGDIVWIATNGLRAVLIDLVSSSYSPDTVEKITEFLNQCDTRIKADELLRKLHVFLQSHGSQAVAAVVDWQQETFCCHWVGNPRLYKLTAENIESLLGQPEIHPMTTLGMQNEPEPKSASFNYCSNSVYWLTSDGLDVQALENSRQAFAADSEQQWRKQCEQCKTDDDWSMVVFPVQLRTDYRKDSWPYDPFVGAQEEREHEKRGLSAIADALFADPEFSGFKIVGSGAIGRANSTRLVDGYLISPWGIVLLELKDHSVPVELKLSAQRMLVGPPELRHDEKNPVNNVTEAVRSFSTWELGVEVDGPLRRIAAVVFTNPLAEVTCIKQTGETCALPCRQGEVLICTPGTLAQQLKGFVRSFVGKRKPAPLSIEQIERVVASLRGDKPELEYQVVHKRQVAGYSMEPEPIAAESTGYYQVYQGYSLATGRPVWIKCFALSALSRESLERHAQNLGREAEALGELSTSELMPRVQRYLGSEKTDEEVIVVLEQVSGLRLDEWLQNNPERSLRICLLKELAKTLAAMAEFNFVHRALSPHNIRVQGEATPVVINFEMCRMEHLATLPISGRHAMDRRFIAEETNQAGARVFPASDTFSFGRLVCLVLTNELHAETYAELKMVARNKQFWTKMEQQAGVPANDLRRLLAPSPMQRPVGQELLEMVNQWQ